MNGLSQIFNAVNIKAVACKCVFMKEERIHYFVTHLTALALCNLELHKMVWHKIQADVQVEWLRQYCLCLGRGIVTHLRPRASQYFMKFQLKYLLDKVQGRPSQEQSNNSIFIIYKFSTHQYLVLIQYMKYVILTINSYHKHAIFLKLFHTTQLFSDFVDCFMKYTHTYIYIVAILLKISFIKDIHVFLKLGEHIMMKKVIRNIED